MSTAVAEVTDTDEALVEDQAFTTEDTDDASIVHDEIEEQDDADLKSDIAKYLSKDEEPSGEADETEVPTEDDPTPEELSQEILTRATAAGLNEETAQRLHENGLLDETLVAFDRRLIESIKPDDAPPAKGDEPEATSDPPPRETERRDDRKDAPPPLNAEEYDDAVVQRDAYHQKRIDALEAEIGRLRQTAEGFVSQQATQFDDWADSQIEQLGNDDLFGKGRLASLNGNDKAKNREKLVEAYGRLCVAKGLDPYQLHAAELAAAYPAVFEKDVIKTTQRKTVDRIKDASGRFVHQPRPGTKGQPAKKKQMSEEDRHAELVSEVDAYLKKTS